jgi:thioredoxin-like negative regulator of GroEL
MAMRPGDTFAYTKALSCLLQTGRVPEAEQVLQQLRAVDPESQEAAMAMGLLAVARGQTGQSRQHFNAVIAHNPSHVQAHQFVALLDGSLLEPQRTSLCGVVRALAPLASSGTTAAAASPCP